MAKPRASDAVHAVRSTDGKRSRRLRRLEDDLADVRATSNKRRKQLALLQEQERRLGEQIAALRSEQAAEASRTAWDEEAGEPATATAGREDVGTGDASAAAAPMAFCMREKQRVTILNPEPIVLKNGRHAIAGSCASCGSHVVAIVKAIAG